ncbi:MAG: HEAT repeat domain-containing protein [Polyangiaceae bacterium]
MTASLRESLSEQDPETRRRAASQLGEYGGSDLGDLLTRALGDTDWRVRKEAVSAAVGHDSPATVIPALVAALAPGENVGLRNAAVEALAGHGEDAVKALAVAIPSLDADGRKLAVDAVAKGGHPSALILLRSLVEDEDPNVRLAAIEALAAIGNACAGDAVRLLSQCLKSADVLARLAALDGLNRLHAIVEFDDVAALIDEPLLAPAAMQALGRTGDARAAALLGSRLAAADAPQLPGTVRAFGDLVESSDDARSAARRVLQSSSPGATQRLVALLSQAEDVSLRRAVLGVLALISDETALDAVLDALDDETLHDAAEYSVDLLGEAADTALAARAASGSAEQRALALELLSRRHGAAQSADVQQAVLAGLASDDARVLRAAVAAAAAIGGRDCVPPVATLLGTSQGASMRSAAEAALSALIERNPESVTDLNEEAHGRAAVAIATAASPLSVHGSRELDVTFLISLLSNDAPHLRRVALDALARLRASSAVDAVSFAVSDEELEVRLAAVRALGRLTSADNQDAVLAQLLELVQTDASLEARVAAIESLGRLQEPRATKALRDLLRAEQVALAVAAVEALAARADAAKSGALVDALTHRDAEVVKAAMRGLNRPGDARAQAHLGVCLDHEAWDVRRLAADLLGRSTLDGAMGLLRTRLSVEREPLVREALTRALESLESTRGVRRTVPPPTRGKLR